MAKQRQRLVEVPFSKTDCGVDFYINTAYGGECPWVLTEHEVFKTDFFEIFFIKKANGYVLIDYRKIKPERRHGAHCEAPPAAGMAHR